MLNGSDAADQVVRYSLEGTEVALKLSGLAAKNVASYLTAVLNDNKKSRGRTHIDRMLREGKPMKIFPIPTEQIKQFAKEAKKYGFLFVAVMDKHGNSKETDVMVFARDAAKVNRVLENLSLASVEAGKVEQEVIKSPFVRDHGSQSETFSRSNSGLASSLRLGAGGNSRTSVRKLLAELVQKSKQMSVQVGKELGVSQPRSRAKPPRNNRAESR